MTRRRLPIWLGALALLALSVASGAARAEAPLRIASDQWCPFVCASDGGPPSGYLVELSAQALGLASLRVEPLLLPLNRAMLEAGNGALAAVYAPPRDRRLLRSVSLGQSQACFYTLPASRWRYTGIAALGRIGFGVIDEYGYDDGPMDAYLQGQHGVHSGVEFNKGEQAGLANVRKLLSGRYPAALEHAAVMQELLRQHGWQGQLRLAGCLEHGLALTLGFAADNPATPAWLASFNAGVLTMRRSGALAALQRRYAIAPLGGR